MAVLNSDSGTALEAVQAAISELENDPATNAGYGSNLTRQGTVECDASIMDGQQGGFGAVAAVGGIANPIQAAYKMCKNGRELDMPAGLVPPMVLAGPDAKAWAAAQGVATIDNDQLTSPESAGKYCGYLQQLSNEDIRQDTVGAICIDAQGHCAAGVSSGGIALKIPGRVGEAAVYGAGCWAQDATLDTPGVACSVSGTGEQIMRSLITTKCMDAIVQHDDVQTALSETIKRSFLESPLLRMHMEPSMGMITLRFERSSSGDLRAEFWYAHVTDSMGIGYMSASSAKPTTFVSRKGRAESIRLSGKLVR
ncbi:nucleophile aminohydrolase [Syncephalastrum racemosum]|uniref:Nucleophile aminohydrolase n=1 Tax=Syncephalastrum racemosum TaxID=13706 RepID=A0A1X2H9R8_SYNRA|nr:nucleophile aminohydrolase [Syncephalastrum racemosum]